MNNINSLYFYLPLAKRMLLAFVFFSLCRILFVVYNFNYFPDIDLYDYYAGLRFDFATISILLSPFIVVGVFPVALLKFRIVKAIYGFLFIAIMTFLTALNFMDMIYYKFTLKRATWDIVDMFYFGNGADVINTLPGFITDYWYIVLGWIFTVFLLIYFYRIVSKNENKFYEKKSNIYLRIIFSMLILGIFFYGARGGMQRRPINIIQAGNNVNPTHIPIVLNTPFTLMKTIYVESVEEKDYFSKEELEKIYTPVYIPDSSAHFAAKNIVIIILESFSKEFIGHLNNGTGYTPFLDSLAKHSLVFNNCFANSKKSIEGIPAVITSIPALMNTPFISSPYITNNITSIANVLKKENYYSAFFHGGVNGTMGFDSFTKQTGFDEYFGKKEYGNDSHYDGTWGIYDEEFFLRFSDEMDRMPVPFITTMFSISSHHPYIIPKKYENKFGNSNLKIHKTIRYTDYSLQQFFKKSADKKWFNNTLFVITADHTAPGEMEKYKTPVGMYAIPMMFYSPSDSTLKGTRNDITQSIDVLSSVLGYLHYEKPVFSFGKNVFDRNFDGYSVSNINNIYQIIGADYVLQHDGLNPIALYEYTKDTLLQNNLIEIRNNEQKLISQELEKKLKAIIQSYNHSLINNKMVIE